MTHYSTNVLVGLHPLSPPSPIQKKPCLVALIFDIIKFCSSNSHNPPPPEHIPPLYTNQGHYH